MNQYIVNQEYQFNSEREDELEELELEEQIGSPLQNTLVIVGIFSYLNLKDLKNCRQVCRLWYEASMPRLKECSRIEILDNGITKTIDNFEKTTALHGFQNYTLDIRRNDSILIKFLNFPNPIFLRDLTINVFPTVNVALQFLSIYRNSLQKLSLSFKKFKRGRINWTIITSLSTNENGEGVKVQLPRLKHLTARHCQFEDFVNFFGTYTTEALENLEIGFNHDMLVQQISPFNDFFPVLNNLKRLSFFAGRLMLPAESIVPNLREVVCECSSQHQLTPNDEPRTTITSLRIEKPFIHNLTRLTKGRFPNLKILIFPFISKQLFRTICREIKTIEKLGVGVHIQDFSIVGSTAYTKKGKWKAIVDSAKEPGFDIRRYRVHPCLSDLPNLTCIEITSSKLTEASILLGLIYCKSLISIKIPIEIPEVSYSTLVAIVDNLPELQTLHIGGRNFRDAQFRDAAMNFLKLSMPNCDINIDVNNYVTDHVSLRPIRASTSQASQNF